MATKGFDLVNALIEAGYKETKRQNPYGKYTAVTYSKTYQEMVTIAWERGEHLHSQDVDVTVFYYSGTPVDVLVQYVGKEKQHGYDKRCYNAIKETLRFRGFSI